MSSITCVLEVSIFSAPVAFLPWILCVLPSAVLAVYSQNTRVRRRWTAGILLLRHWCIASPFVFFKCQKSPAFIWNIFLISSFIHKENEELSSTVLLFFFFFSFPEGVSFPFWYIPPLRKQAEFILYWCMRINSLSFFDRVVSCGYFIRISGFWNSHEFVLTFILSVWH